MNAFDAVLHDTQVRRANTEGIGYGPWLGDPSFSNDLCDAIFDRITEHDQMSGIVQVHGAYWLYRTV